MKNFIYLVEPQSGRVVMLKRDAPRVFSYTFLPRFDAVRLCRVVLRVCDAEDINTINTYKSNAIVMLGVLASLGRSSQPPYMEVFEQLVTGTSIEEVRVEA